MKHSFSFRNFFIFTDIFPNSQSILGEKENPQSKIAFLTDGRIELIYKSLPFPLIYLIQIQMSTKSNLKLEKKKEREEGKWESGGLRGEGREGKEN